MKRNYLPKGMSQGCTSNTCTDNDDVSAVRRGMISVVDRAKNNVVLDLARFHILFGLLGILTAQKKEKKKPRERSKESDNNVVFNNNHLLLLLNKIKTMRPKTRSKKIEGCC